MRSKRNNTHRQNERVTAMSLLSIETDAKTVKGEKQGYMTGILYLAPHTLAGIGNLCPDASEGCKATCLYTAGRGVFNYVQQARIAKTKRFKADRAGFMAELVKDVAALVRKARRAGMIPVVRLNGTSDLPWENIAAPMVTDGHMSGAGINLMAAFPDVQFYDYTKSLRRMLAWTRGEMPSNYHLTFSRSECNDHEAKQVLAEGGNVAVVFDTKKGAKLPEWWNGYAVVDGDVSDLRFTDKACSACARPFTRLSGGVEGCAVHGIRSALVGRGLVVGLRAKGKARKDASGFVVSA